MIDIAGKCLHNLNHGFSTNQVSKADGAMRKTLARICYGLEKAITV